MTLPVLRSALLGSILGSTDGLTAAMWTPLADVTETDDAYLVELELPGVGADDVNVETTGNELIVSGEFKEVDRDGSARSRTRRVGRFEHRTILPKDVGVEKITANLTNGVLTVRVPKSETAKPRRIPVAGG